MQTKAKLGQCRTHSNLSMLRLGGTQHCLGVSPRSGHAAHSRASLMTQLQPLRLMVGLGRKLKGEVSKCLQLTDY